jgi:hypothetical protein
MTQRELSARSGRQRWGEEKRCPWAVAREDRVRIVRLRKQTGLEWRQSRTVKQTKPESAGKNESSAP